MKTAAQSGPTELTRDESLEKMRGRYLGGRKVEADLKGGNVSADGGVLLLWEGDRPTGLIEHTVPELLRQRILGMAMGDEDLNDHDSLRREPMIALGVGNVDPLGLDRCGSDRGRALAGKSALNRLELTNATTGKGTVRGVHTVNADHEAIQRLLVRLAFSCLEADTKESERSGDRLSAG